MSEILFFTVELTSRYQVALNPFFQGDKRIAVSIAGIIVIPVNNGRGVGQQVKNGNRQLGVMGIPDREREVEIDICVKLD